MTTAAPTTDKKPVLLVAAAVLLNADKKVLIATRPKGKAMAGQWEFAGGKMEAGETPEATVVREYAEELGVTIAIADLTPLTFASHTYEKFHLLMSVFLCQTWQGEPQAQEGQQLAWATLDDLPSYDFVAADIPMIPTIQKLLR